MKTAIMTDLNASLNKLIACKALVSKALGEKQREEVLKPLVEVARLNLKA